MRKTLLVFILISFLFPLVSLAQSDDALNVKLRTASDERNVLLEKSYQDLGDITADYGTTVTFQTLIISYPDQAKPTVKGVHILVRMPKMSSDLSNAADEDNADDEIAEVEAFIDIDEVEALIKVIPRMITTAEQWDGLKTEKYLSFTTRDDFSVTVNQTTEGKQFTTLYAYDSDSAMAFFKTPQHLLTIKGYMEKAIKQFNR